MDSQRFVKLTNKHVNYADIISDFDNTVVREVSQEIV